MFANSEYPNFFGIPKEDEYCLARGYFSSVFGMKVFMRSKEMLVC
jgi:hypothetical protein